MPTYSTNINDYKGKYNPDTEDVFIVDGYGSYIIPKDATNRELNNLVDEIQYSEQTTYEDLVENKRLIDAYKRRYQEVNGEEFQGTDQEAVDDYMTDMTRINWNTVDFVQSVWDVYTSDNEQSKADLGYMLDTFDRVKATGEGSRGWWAKTKDIGGALATDVTLYAGIATGGLGLIGRSAAKKVAADQVKKSLVKSAFKPVQRLADVAVKYPKSTVGAIGFGYGAGYEAGFQGIAQKSGVEQKKIDLDILDIEDAGFEKRDILFAGGLGAGAGIGGTVAANTISKVVKSVIKPKFTPTDRSQRSRKELLKEIEEEGINPDIARDPSSVETIIHTKKVLKDSKKNKEPIQWLDKDQENIEVFVGNDKQSYKFSDEQLVEVEELVNKKLDETEKLSQELQMQPSRTPEQIRMDVEKKYAKKNNIKETGREIELLDEEGNIVATTFLNSKGGIDIQKNISDDALRVILSNNDAFKNRIDTTITSAYDGLQNRVARQMTANRGLPASLKNRLDQTPQDIRGKVFGVQKNVEKLDRIIKSGSGISLSKAGPEIHVALKQALIDNKVFGKGPNKHKNILHEFFKNDAEKLSKLDTHIKVLRDDISETSNLLLQSGFVRDGTELYNTIKKGIDHQKYTHQQFGIYENPTALSKSLEQQIKTLNITDDAGNYIKDNTEKLSHLITKVKNKFDLKTDSDAKLALHLLRSKDKKAFNELGQLAPKKLRDKTLKEIAGDITDPRQVYTQTVLKTYKLAQDYNLKKDLVREGLGQGIMIRGLKQPKGINEQLVELGKTKRTFALSDKEIDTLTQEGLSDLADDPFKNIFTNETFKKAYKVATEPYSRVGTDNAVLRGILGTTAAFHTNRILLSPTTHMRSLLGGAGNNVSNGVLPISIQTWNKQMGSRKGVFRDALPFFHILDNGLQLQPTDIKRIQKLIRLNTLSGGARSQEFIQTWNTLRKNTTALDALEKEAFLGVTGTKTAQKALNKLSQIYQLTDDFNRIKAFEFEYFMLDVSFGQGQDASKLVNFAKKLGVFDAENLPITSSDPQVITLLERVAAAKVSMYNPTYNQLPRLISNLKNVGLGNFVSHPTEVVRNYKNAWKLAVLETSSGIKGQMGRGMLRASALTGYSAFSLGIPTGVGSFIYGISDEEEKALNSSYMTSPYDYGFNNMARSEIKDGKLVMANTGWTDGLSALSRPLRVFWKRLQESQEINDGDPEIEMAVVDAVKAFLIPYANPAQGPLVLIQAAQALGKQVNGRELTYREEKDLATAIKSVFMPQIIMDVDKAYRRHLLFFKGKERTIYGTEVDPAKFTMMGWVTSLKNKTVDIPVSAGFGLKLLNRESNAINTDFNKVKDDIMQIPVGTQATPKQREKLIEAYEKFLKDKYENGKKVRQLYLNYNTLATPKNFGGDLYKYRYELFVDIATSGGRSKEFTRLKRYSGKNSEKFKANFNKDFIGNITRSEPVVIILSEPFSNEEYKDLKPIFGTDTLLKIRTMYKTNAARPIIEGDE